MITRLLSKVQQLKGRSSHELYSRISQRVYALRERAALRLGTGSQPFHALNQSTFGQPFFAGVADVASTVATLRTVVPDVEREILERAKVIERGDIPLLGYGLVHIGQSPEWQRDPFANLSAPLRHWSTIPYLDPSIVGDHKVVWEISRHQYFVTLGQAWKYSRDERWPRAFVRYLQSWLDGNPAGVGMNWASSLEVSYRAISWIWALQLMRDSSSVDNELKARTLASLQSHGRHVERYLSTYFSPNTHLTGEALGLFYIGTQCPELPEAKRWCELGASVLETSLAKQVLSDGVYFEQATQYHRYTIDIYLHYLMLARIAGRGVSPSVEQALHKMFDVLLFLTRGDGTIPLIGDDDGGRLVQLDNRMPHEVRALLATGAVVLNRPDLAWMGRGDDAAMCWMLGGSSVDLRDRLVHEPPTDCSRDFAAGGMYVMRSGWNSHDGHLVIDAGPHGALSFGHSHADALSVELSVGGTPLFVDAGTYTYVGSERDEFRTTAAHNTIEVDAVSTSEPGSPFRWQSVAHASATSWTVEPEFACFTGQHSAYSRLASPVAHSRQVLQAAAGLWIVRDALVSNGEHDTVLRWHCAPGVDATVQATASGFSALNLSEGDTNRAVLAMFGGNAGAAQIASGWISQQFGHRTPAPVCEWRERTNGNAVLASVVIDSGQYAISYEATARFRQQVGTAMGVLALTSVNSSAAEILLVVIGDGRSMKVVDLDIAADIACIRVDDVKRKAVGILAVGVSNISKPGPNGVTFVRSETGTQWASIPNLDAREVAASHVRSGAMLPPVTPKQNTNRRSVHTPSTV